MVLVGRAERKQPLGRPRRRWNDHVKTGLQEMRSGSIERINLAQDRDRRW
jgi:hypothetical protein